MSNQEFTSKEKQPEQPRANQRTLLHIQVAGSPSPEHLQQVAELFLQAGQDQNGSVVATPEGVTVTQFPIPNDQQVVPLQVVGTVSPELIAQVAHEVNRAYCTAIDDNSLQPWASEAEDNKTRIRSGVQNHLRNPNLTPQQSHVAWMKARTADGWVYGPVKDAEQKTHPALLPYEGLPLEQKVKDFLFKSVVSTLRDRLPTPTQKLQEIEVFIQETQAWVPGHFQHLLPNYIWRFTDQPGRIFLSQSEPYLNYTESGTAWSIDAQHIVFQPAPDATEGAVSTTQTPGSVDENIQTEVVNDEVNEERVDASANFHEYTGTLYDSESNGGPGDPSGA